MGASEEEISAFCGENPSCGQMQNQLQTVELPGYWLKQTPITVAEYYKCVQADACPSLGIEKVIDGLQQQEMLSQPLVMASLEVFDQYARWAGGRLPTEAEWRKPVEGSTVSSSRGEMTQRNWETYKPR